MKTKITYISLLQKLHFSLCFQLLNLPPQIELSVALGIKQLSSGSFLGYTLRTELHKRSIPFEQTDIWLPWCSGNTSTSRANHNPMLGSMLVQRLRHWFNIGAMYTGLQRVRSLGVVNCKHHAAPCGVHGDNQSLVLMIDLAISHQNHQSSVKLPRSPGQKYWHWSYFCPDDRQTSVTAFWES